MSLPHSVKIWLTPVNPFVPNFTSKWPIPCSWFEHHRTSETFDDMQWQAAEELEICTCTCESNAPDIFRSGVALTRLYTTQVCELFNWVDSVTIHYYWRWRRSRTEILDLCLGPGSYLHQIWCLYRSQILSKLKTQDRQRDRHTDRQADSVQRFIWPPKEDANRNLKGKQKRV